MSRTLVIKERADGSREYFADGTLHFATQLPGERVEFSESTWAMYGTVRLILKDGSDGVFNFSEVEFCDEGTAIRKVKL